MVSSEDAEILEVARQWGAEVPFVRPRELAQDDTPGIDVVWHALSLLPGYDWVVLLQPTSPMRTAGDIEAALQHCWRADAPACVGVTPAACNPWWMFGLGRGGRLKPLLPPEQRPARRQDAPELFELNGAVYVAQVDWLRRNGSFVGDETVAYVMDPVCSVDIDTELDLEWAEFLMCRRLNEPSGP
ncbi:N-acylneuraminate cytidylyltransferase [Tepidimonas ignava]|uniref:CMP-N,N'-diacetyllegionaminic acid synthase n=1 Tax=Tepidimonas ignava TaxID=114249 RepID=A0A4R3L8J5_9BURK|nr:N-acylneuraminate cytidylyltransferase [Tepidimonas ignava]TSE19982.1 CMP-N,N'-diacetyllegionaminic acid synthase [Tepidimonas ignava]